MKRKDALEGHVFDLAHDGMTAAEFDAAFDDLCRTFLVEPDDAWLEGRNSFALDPRGITGADWRVAPSRRDKMLEASL
jgi:hypothetical protein